MFQDQARQNQRRKRKAQGLPASDDVATIASMISELREKVELELGHNITSALAAVPNLPGLCREDIDDAFEYLSLRTLDDPLDQRTFFRHPAALTAFNGFGLCERPFDEEHCRKEIEEMPEQAILTVSYNRNALCVESSEMHSVFYYYPYETQPSSMDFTLGSDAYFDNPHPRYYREAMRRRIMTAIIRGLPANKPDKVFIHGESLYEEWLVLYLADACDKLLGGAEQVAWYPEEPFFSVAQGAAELARRGGYVSNPGKYRT